MRKMKKKATTRKPLYRTPKGKDEREVPIPDRFKYMGKGYKTIKYGHTMNLVGPGFTTKITDEIRAKINKNMSVVICVTGPPGTGKTYMGKRWAQKLDPEFHITDTPPPPPDQDHGQITFSREHIAYLTGENTPLHRGQVILTDESHWGIGARSWQNKDQQDVVNYLAAIRSKGFVLIIVVLHTRMIDTLLRDFVLNYEFHVTTRGEATVYRRWFPIHASEPYRKRLGRIRMQLPDEALCNYSNCLRGRYGCKWLHPEKTEDRCMTLRAIYERRKEWFLNEKGKEKAEENSEKEKHRITKKDRRAVLTEDDIKLIPEGHKEKFDRNYLHRLLETRISTTYKQACEVAGDLEYDGYKPITQEAPEN